MTLWKYLQNQFVAVFLLLLIISGNFLGDLLPCRLQHRLKDSYLAKHMCVLFTIVYSIVLVNRNETLSGNKILANTFCVYVAFLLTTKMDADNSLIMFLMLGIMHLLTIYNSDKKEKRISIICNGLMILIGITIGNGIYRHVLYNKKKFGDKFSWTKFIFKNKHKCSAKIYLKNAEPPQTSIQSILERRR